MRRFWLYVVTVNLAVLNILSLLRAQDVDLMAPVVRIEKLEVPGFIQLPNSSGTKISGAGTTLSISGPQLNVGTEATSSTIRMDGVNGGAVTFSPNLGLDTHAAVSWSEADGKLYLSTNTGGGPATNQVSIDGAGTVDVLQGLIAHSGVTLSTSAGATVKLIASDPSGVVTEPRGSLRLRTDNGTLYQNADGGTTWTLLQTAASTTTIIQDSTSLSIYGDGSDGDVTIGAGTTTLTSDMFYSNLTVPAGATLKTGGFRIFVRNTLTIGGSISDEGNPGGNGGTNTGGAGGSGRALSFMQATPAGGNGNATGAGSVGGAVNPTYAGGANTGGAAGSAGAIGGLGGDGGAGTGLYKGGGGGGGGGSTGVGTAGGAGGTVTADAETVGSRPHQAFVCLTGGRTAGTSPKFGGSGGGGGGCGWSSGGTEEGCGGGGGAGGGTVYVAARLIVASGSATITAKGGNGGNGGNASSGNAGGGGGGGGGAGGNACVYSQTSEATMVGAGLTITAAGGSGGALGLGQGTGRNGAVGGNGATGVRYVAAPP